MRTAMSSQPLPAPAVPPPDPARRPIEPGPPRYAEVDAPVPSVPNPPETVPTLPALPTLPPVAAIPTVSPAIVAPGLPNAGGAVMPDGIATVPRAMPPRRRRRSPWWHTVVRTLIVLAVVGGIVTAAVLGVRGYRSATSLPEYDAGRPDYGTVVVDLDLRVDGTELESRITADGTSRVWSHEGVVDAEELAMVSDGTDVWLSDGAEWVRFVDSDELVDVIHRLGRVPIYTDLVPPSAREHFEVIDKDRVVLGGREVGRLELGVEAGRFERADPVTYSNWIGAGDPAGAAPELVRIVIHVDPDGVVWRIESWSDLNDDRVTVELVSFDAQAFTVEPPETYLDPETGVQFVDGEPVDCESERRTLEVVVEAYTIDIGVPPASEAEAIPAYLRRDLVGYDIAEGGRVVPVEGICA